MSNGNSVVRNNHHNLPSKHPFIVLVLRVPEMQIPLSALLFFTNKQEKKGNKDMAGQIVLRRN